jgi:hypothetical protein
VVEAQRRPPEREKKLIGTPQGCEKRLLAPLQGAVNCSTVSGGLRFASTTGYFRRTLRVQMPILNSSLSLKKEGRYKKF